MGYGPALPPGFVKKRHKNSDDKFQEPVEKKRAIGPTLHNVLPPVKVETKIPDPSPEPELSDDDDDIYGPKIPMSALSAEQLRAIQEKEQTERLVAIEARARKEKKTNVIEQKAVQRESWMTLPPKPNRATAQFTSRTFSMKGTQDFVDQSIWTSTPETRDSAELASAKLQLQHLDKQRLTAKKDQNAKDMVAALNRGKASLLDTHLEKNADKLDISQKRFDRERDIVGNAMGSKSKEQMVKDAKDLNSKFSSGSSYL